MADLTLLLADSDRDSGLYGDLALSPTGDLLLTDSAQSIRQALLLRLQASVGDYFMAPAEGIAWLEMLGSIGGYNDSFDAVLRNTVLNTPGVLGLLGWNVGQGASKDVLSVDMEVATAEGTINFSLPVTAEGAT